MCESGGWQANFTVGMKKSHLIAIVCVIAAIAVIMSAAGETSSYATFSQASEHGDRVQVVGELAKERPIVYDPQVNPNYFSFYVRDVEGRTEKVVLLQAKPQDFEMSEQVVVTGEMMDGQFVATDLLMKCPSKYKDEMVALKAES